MKQLLCRNCFAFIYDKLELKTEVVSKKLGMKIYTHTIKHKCTFCKNDSVVSYKDYNNNRKYYICQSHLNRWLKIGCQLGELSNFLTIE